LGFDAGTLVFSGTPAQADLGSLSLRLTATDGAGATAYADFALTVGPVNDAPAVSGVVDLGTIVEDGARTITAAELLALASDTDGDALIVVAPTIASGQGTLVADGAGGWIFTPDPNWHGAVELAYEVSDGTTSAPASATLNVLPVNDAPILVLPISDQAATEGQPFVLAVDAGSFADVDAGDALTYTATLADGSALPAWLGFDAGTLVFSGTPAQADLGSLNLRLTATDGAGATAHADFALTVGPVNDAPAVSGVVDLGTIVEDGARTISAAELLALASDADGDALSVLNPSIVSGQGTLVADGTGGWIFTPDAGWHGAVEFAFEVSDGATSTAASAALGVTPPSDPPPSDPPPSDPPPSDPPPSDPPPSDPPPSDPPPSDPPPSDPPPSDPPPSDPPAPDSPRPSWRPAASEVDPGGSAWPGAQTGGAEPGSASSEPPSTPGAAPSSAVDRDAPQDDDAGAGRGVSAPRRPNADGGPAAGRADGEGEAAVATASTRAGDDTSAWPLAAWEAMASWVRGFSTGAVTVAIPDFEQLALRSVRAFLGDDELLRRFQRLEEQAGARAEAREVSLASGVALTSALSIGYVVWLVRGGVLLSSVLSTLPAWQLLDPLPVLARARSGDDEDDDGGDAVERLFDEDGQAGAGRRPPGAPDTAAIPLAVPAPQPGERAMPPHGDPR
ncbi:MAG: cadherin-like domain-containing protein, partial [Burkholderiales bacterium]|nr:cadherin-like domain-containing protein [Burkholderiales bacterium]